MGVSGRACSGTAPADNESDSDRQRHVEAQSLIGCYMLSVLCGDVEHAAEHDRQLLSGEPPVMQAELIVARIIFESLIQRMFTSLDEEAIDAFVVRLPATSERVSRDAVSNAIKRALRGANTKPSFGHVSSSVCSLVRPWGS